MLELGEHLFDRVQVGAVGRQEEEARTDAADSGADGRTLVTAQVIHDDNVAGGQRRQQALLDICDEALAVDRLVEDTGRVDAVTAQRRQEGHGAPVAVWNLGIEPSAAWRPASERSEEHTSELQSLMRISYAVFCL